MLGIFLLDAEHAIARNMIRKASQSNKTLLDIYCMFLFPVIYRYVIYLYVYTGNDTDNVRHYLNTFKSALDD